MNRGRQSHSGAADSGRHRHGSAGTWTPSVPSQGGASRHEPSRADDLVDTGLSQGRIAGELPIPQQGAPEAPQARPAPSDSRTRQQPKRTRVTFTQPERPPVTPGQDTAQQRDEPAREQDTSQTGLGVFDLGSVPASVTPPRTWRKAAWFAAGSSCGVVGLLFAGSFLLAQQPSDPHAGDEWTYLNRGDDAPMLRRDDLLRNPTRPPGSPERTRRDSSARTTTSARPGEPSTTGSDDPTASSTGGLGGDPATSGTRGSGSGGSSSGSNGSAQSTDSSSTARTTQPPEKPPPTTAPSEVVNRRPTLYSARNTDQMSQRSQKFLNTVTENPQRADELTSGQLHDKGAKGLRRKYSDVAYFEVKKVVINQGKGVTTNTVKTVYNDGHSETQRVTLTFDKNGKISKATG